MVKKVIIEIILVPESFDEQSDKIKEEILKELREGFSLIPWSYEIEHVRVVET